jgi:hypothetical protein
MHIVRTPREGASRGKTRKIDTCRGASQRQSTFDVLKGASPRVARSDWTAAHVLFKTDNAMAASHGLWFVLPRMLASLSEATDG